MSRLQNLNLNVVLPRISQIISSPPIPWTQNHIHACVYSTPPSSDFTDAQADISWVRASKVAKAFDLPLFHTKLDAIKMPPVEFFWTFSEKPSFESLNPKLAVPNNSQIQQASRWLDDHLLSFNPLFHVGIHVSDSRISLDPLYENMRHLRLQSHLKSNEHRLVSGKHVYSSFEPDLNVDRKHPLIRACSLEDASSGSNTKIPRHQVKILDITAGCGHDSSILYNAGFSVTMVERNPLFSLILKNGMARFNVKKTVKTDSSQEEEPSSEKIEPDDDKVQPQLELFNHTSEDILSSIAQGNSLPANSSLVLSSEYSPVVPDIIYYDPFIMFKGIRTNSRNRKGLVLASRILPLVPQIDVARVLDQAKSLFDLGVKKIVFKVPKRFSLDTELFTKPDKIYVSKNASYFEFNH